MYKFNEDAIREAAYYIWKNNGCPANTSLSDWDAAINQLTANAGCFLKAPKKISAAGVLMPKKASKAVSILRNVKSIILKPASAAKAQASSASKAAVKAAPKKVAAKKAAPKKVVAKKAAPKKVVAKKAAPKKVVAKKVAPKKVVAKKVAPKKVVAKKSK